MSSHSPVLIAVAALFSSVSSLAGGSLPVSVEQFRCQTARPIDAIGAPTQFMFKVGKFADGHFELGTFGLPDADRVVIAVPRNSLLMNMSDYGLFVGAKGLLITADNDGFQNNQILLYANSGLTRGYVSIKEGSGSGTGNHYSRISCQRKPAVR